MMKKILVAFIAVAVMSGCSSIISKSEYSVAINSNPSDANFRITNRAGLEVDHGITPKTVVLKSSSGYFKGETYTIAVNKDGFAAQNYTLQSTTDGWYIGNLLFGGLIGMLIVDPATGAMYNLPSRVDVNLNTEKSVDENMTLRIDTYESLTPLEITRLEPIDIQSAN
jgi:hypothetical protein